MRGKNKFFFLRPTKVRQRFFYPLSSSLNFSNQFAAAVVSFSHFFFYLNILNVYVRLWKQDSVHFVLYILFYVSITILCVCLNFVFLWEERINKKIRKIKLSHVPFLFSKNIILFGSNYCCWIPLALTEKPSSDSFLLVFFHPDTSDTRDVFFWPVSQS